jgi:phosphoglycerol transferase MdoB-like AlkP superfamily enzyme
MPTQVTLANLSSAWGDRQYPWSSPTVIALLVVGIVVLIAFVLYENFMKLPQPLLPMSLFKIRNFWVAVVVGSIGQMAYYAMNILCKALVIQSESYRSTNASAG